MTSNSADSQLKAAYEQGMSPEEIASEFKYDLAAVKSKLMQISPAYRKVCRTEPEEEDRANFSIQQLETVTQELFNLAMGTDDEHLKGKLLMYIRDDKKGRHEVVKAIQNAGNFNLIEINQMMIQARSDSTEEIKRALSSTKKVAAHSATIEV